MGSISLMETLWIETKDSENEISEIEIDGGITDMDLLQNKRRDTLEFEEKIVSVTIDSESSISKLSEVAESETDIESKTESQIEKSKSSISAELDSVSDCLSFAADMIPSAC